MAMFPNAVTDTRNVSSLLKDIEKSLETHLKELRERTIVEAVKSFESQLRETMASATIKVSDYFDVLNQGYLIQIRAKVENAG